MFAVFEKTDTKLEIALDRALAHLEGQKIDSAEYAKTLEHVIKLQKMREEEKPARLSADTKALIAANLTGILLIIRHENVNVITTKAMNLITKVR